MPRGRRGPRRQRETVSLREASLRPRRRRWIIAIVLLSATAVADHCGWLLARGQDDMTAYHGIRARVNRVIDGVTLEVDIPDSLHDRRMTRVRLWGVDSPRPAGPERYAEPLAGDAEQLATKLTHGRMVVLSLETQRTRGPMGAVLAHVRLPGGASLNERILAEGLARADERWPHAQLTRYAEIERSARRIRRGQWSDIGDR